MYTYSHCCFGACIRFGALFSRYNSAASFSTMICISGFGVVRWCLTLSFPRAYGIRRHNVYCCARGVFCRCCFLQQRAAVCGIIFKITCNGVKQNNDFGPVRTPKNNDFWDPILRNPAATKTHPLEFDVSRCSCCSREPVGIMWICVEPVCSSQQGLIQVLQ